MIHFKSSKKISGVLVLLIVIFFLSACKESVFSSETKMVFSFNTSSYANSYDEKTIYINNDMDKLELDAELQIDSGNVIIQVLSSSNDEIIWSNSYMADSSFKIEMFDIKENSEYLLTIKANQSQKVKLTITTDSKLLKNKEKSEKYIIEKK